mmetsp:Transcript_17410/g.44411  ORF Transcript_17410/g.44411 Transcript_17410/m.44411 type:complete len:86 (-) Transcript_17410:59-316(-)
MRGFEVHVIIGRRNEPELQGTDWSLRPICLSSHVEIDGILFLSRLSKGPFMSRKLHVSPQVNGGQRPSTVSFKKGTIISLCPAIS